MLTISGRAASALISGDTVSPAAVFPKNKASKASACSASGNAGCQLPFAFSVLTSIKLNSEENLRI